MNESTKCKKKCIYSIKKTDNIKILHLLESSRSLQQTVPLSFLLQFFVNTADLSRFSLANSFQATLWREIIGLSFKQNMRSTLAWGFHKFIAWFLWGIFNRKKYLESNQLYTRRFFILPTSCPTYSYIQCLSSGSV